MPGPFSADRASSESKISLTKDDFILKLLQLIRLPVWMLNIVGIHVKSSSASFSQRTATSKVEQGLTLLSKTVFVLLHLFNISRLIAIFTVYFSTRNNGNMFGLFLLALAIVYSATIFTSETVAFKICLQQLIKSFETYSVQFGFLHDVCGRQHMAKMFTTVAVISNISCAVIWFLTEARWFGTTDLMNPFTESKFDAASTYVLSLMYYLIGVLIMLTIQGSLLLHTLFVWLIIDEFKATSKRLAELLKVYDNTTETHFDQCRERHQSLCRIVAHFNKLTKPSMTVNIIFNMVIVFTYIYGLGTSKLSLGRFILQIISGASINIVVVIFLTLLWGKIPNAVNSVVAAINDANWSVMSQNLIQKMGLFLNLCGNQKIGVDFLGLFTLDSNTPLMVLGTMLTYGIVILQLPQGNHVVCMCGSNTTDA